MSVLTMTFLGLETRNDLPKVSYMTALDYFVTLNFAFIFATIVQFAIVHYFTKIGSGEYYIPPPEILKRLEIARKETEANKEGQEAQNAKDATTTRGRSKASLDNKVGNETTTRDRRREETIPFQLNSVSQIDKFCRILFPVTFIVVNYFYWNNYLNDDEDDIL